MRNSRLPTRGGAFVWIGWIKRSTRLADLIGHELLHCLVSMRGGVGLAGGDQVGPSSQPFAIKQTTSEARFVNTSAASNRSISNILPA
jgi:hypothetical protein